MKKLLIVLFLFLVLVFAIISFYNTLVCVSKQPMVNPLEKKELDEAKLLKHLTGALRIQVLSSPIDSLQNAAYKQMHDYLEICFRNIYTSPNVERKTLAEKSILYKWVGRNPKLKPILILGQLDVKDPPLKQVPQWTYNPFLGKLADGYIYGAGVMGGKSISLAILEALDQHIADGVLPERTLYIALLNDMESDTAQSLNYLINSLKSSGLEFETIIGAESYITDNAQLSKPLALIQCAERHRVHLQLKAADLQILTALVDRIQQDELPVARKAMATEQFLWSLLPELSFGKRWALCNWSWAGFLAEKQLRNDPQIGPMLNSSCELLKLEKSADGIHALAELTWLSSPDYGLEDFKKRYMPYLNGVEAIWSADRDGAAAISPSEGYAYEALRTTIKQIFGDVYVMPGIGGHPSKLSLFKEITVNCYHFRPYQFEQEDMERIKSGIDHRLRVENYLQGVRFYTQLLKNMVL